MFHLTLHHLFPYCPDGQFVSHAALFEALSTDGYFCEQLKVKLEETKMTLEGLDGTLFSLSSLKYLNVCILYPKQVRFSPPLQ